MRHDGRPLLWCGLWIVALAALLATVVHTLRVGNDLRFFLPKAATPGQAIVLQGIGEGPAARMLIVALKGAAADTLARTSRKLAASLRTEPSFRLVANGSTDVPRWLIDNRYLLTSNFDRRPLDAETLRAALQDRLQDLASPAGPALEAIMPSDPTLEVANIAGAWEPGRSPRMIGGVWFDPDGRQALLLLHTQAAGFDPGGQQKALDALDAAFVAAKEDASVRMTVSGTGRFSALMKERTQNEASRLATAATVGLIMLLLVAYRRWRAPVLAPLPLATAALVGLAAVGAVHGEVHGITLAFGFTLIGVAQDYPVHLFSHQHPGIPPLETARRLWPTLATGVAATCVAYLAFLASGVTGLEQLGLFSITGLAAAGLSTRYLLPRAIGEDFRDPAQSEAIARLDRWLTRPRLSPAAYMIAMAAGLGVMAWAPGPAWQDDLGALTPVPPALLAENARLRQALGAPDPRFFVVVTSRDSEAALARLEALTPGLQSLAADGVIAGFEHAAKFLPSVERQRWRQSRLPAPAALADALAEASKDAPFRAGIFAPFLADVERARIRAPLTLAAVRGTGQAPLVEGLLHESAGVTRAIIVFSGVSDSAGLRQWAAAAGPDTAFIDLKGEATALVVAQRQRILLCLAVAAVLLTLVVRVALGGFAQMARVMAPVALSTVTVVAALRAFGTPLDLFHLMSLVLAAGLGIDYALFFERAGAERVERLRTLHAVLVSAISTLMVFGLLSLSTTTVLRSIGVTVTFGVTLNFLLALSLLPRGGTRT